MPLRQAWIQHGQNLVRVLTGRLEATWEADISQGSGYINGPDVVNFAGWPFRLGVYRGQQEGPWGVLCYSSSPAANAVPKGWELRSMRVDMTLSCPEAGWSKAFVGEQAIGRRLSWEACAAVVPPEGATHLKVQVVITKLVVEIGPGAKGMAETL
jgi:hypothetical protein